MCSLISTHSGIRLLSAGFTLITPWIQVGETSFPEIKVDDQCEISSLTLDERETCAPGYLTESELIQMVCVSVCMSVFLCACVHSPCVVQMEKHGIGTDASIPTHIKNIVDRNYVRLAAGRTLVPENLGIVLTHGVSKCACLCQSVSVCRISQD